MEKQHFIDLAGKNLSALASNPYPGRGIICGLDESSKYLIQVYWIMGRSENSRNRIFVIEDGGVLKTAAADPAKVKDPSLIIYTAMSETLTKYAVSNGHQTVDALSESGLDLAMMNWTYEPDQPNYTPRISALLEPKVWSEQVVEMSILKKSPINDECERHIYNLPLSIPGLGYCITTYAGDGNPLPPFAGDPYLLPLAGSIEDVARAIWAVLNEDNRVSLAVKFIEIKKRETLMTVINKYNAV